MIEVCKRIIFECYIRQKVTFSQKMIRYNINIYYTFLKKNPLTEQNLLLFICHFFSTFQSLIGCDFTRSLTFWSSFLLYHCFDYTLGCYYSFFWIHFFGFPWFHFGKALCQVFLLNTYLFRTIILMTLHFSTHWWTS